MANTQRAGFYLFVMGVVMMLADVAYGKLIQDEVTAFGLAGIKARYGDTGGLRVLLFAFAWPLGAGLALLGAGLFGGTAKTRAGRFGGFALLTVLMPVLVPGIFGSAH